MGDWFWLVGPKGEEGKCGDSFSVVRVALKRKTGDLKTNQI